MVAQKCLRAGTHIGMVLAPATIKEEGTAEGG